MKKGKPEKLIIDGKRLDGRDLEEMREIEAKIGVISRADGSAMFRFGNTVAIAAVYGPRPMFPKHLQDPEKAVIQFRYNMAPFSCEERVRPGTSRRSVEISKVIREALAEAIWIEEFPRTVIDIYVEILQSDGSTRCAAINAASLALADAGVPLKDLICACSVGKVDGEIVLDVNGKEDNYGEVDMPVAMIPRGEKIVLLQMDGELTFEEFEKCIELAKKGCKKVYELQKEVIRKKYAIIAEEV
ncbi:MAG TPA: exosome complex exonuclease Rrp41 [Nanoarchaeota archaeon]|nr:exosome complex exonuclease Rrp41 [Nanoarchaeota archaeon]